MDIKKILNAMRELQRVIRADVRAQTEFDALSDVLSEELGFDLREGESVFEERPARAPLDFSELAAPPPRNSMWWEWASYPDLMVDRVQCLRTCLDNEESIDPNDCQAAIELIYVLLEERREQVP
jgi:hypothetical protein